MGWKSLARASSCLDFGAVQFLDSKQSGVHVQADFRGRGPLHQEHLLDAVDLLELHLDDLRVRGLHHAPDEAGLDGQLAMAAVDQRQQLHPRRAPVIEQRVESRADGAAGVEHIVHQDDVLALHRKGDLGGAHHRLDIHGREIVAVQIDIEDAHRNPAFFERLDLPGQPLRQGNAAAADPDKSQQVQVLGLLQDFMSQTDQRPVDFRCAHELKFFAREGHKAPKDRVSQELTPPRY